MSTISFGIQVAILFLWNDNLKLRSYTARDILTYPKHFRIGFSIAKFQTNSVELLNDE